MRKVQHVQMALKVTGGMPKSLCHDTVYTKVCMELTWQNLCEGVNTWIVTNLYNL